MPRVFSSAWRVANGSVQKLASTRITLWIPRGDRARSPGTCLTENDRRVESLGTWTRHDSRERRHVRLRTLSILYPHDIGRRVRIGDLERVGTGWQQNAGYP